MSITLYTHPMSPCSQKVRIILAEKNLAREEKLFEQKVASEGDLIEARATRALSGA